MSDVFPVSVQIPQQRWDQCSMYHWEDSITKSYSSLYGGRVELVRIQYTPYTVVSTILADIKSL